MSLYSSKSKRRRLQQDVESDFIKSQPTHHKRTTRRKHKLSLGQRKFQKIKQEEIEIVNEHFSVSEEIISSEGEGKKLNNSVYNRLPKKSLHRDFQTTHYNKCSNNSQFCESQSDRSTNENNSVFSKLIQRKHAEPILSILINEEQSSTIRNCDHSETPNIKQFLQDDFMINKLLHQLGNKNLTNDFLNLLQLIASGTLSLDNVCIRSAIELARFLNLNDTRCMVYSDITRNYWNCVYKILGGPGLRLFSGPRGVGTNTFDPLHCKVNFAVPSESTLANIQSDIPKLILPSIFDSVIQNLSYMLQFVDKEYVLSFDGKGLSQGFKGDSFGDVNLFGIEGPPSLEEQERRLDTELLFLDDVKKELTEENYVETKENLRKLLKIITLRIKDTRETISLQQKLNMKYTKMKENNPDNQNKYNYILASTKYTEANCRVLIKRALSLNKDICIACAALNGCSNFISTSCNVKLDKQSNYFGLLNPDQVPDIVQIPGNEVYVKQRSPLWHELRNKALVTGSTCNAALGLNTLIAQKEHYNHYVVKKPKEPISEDLQRMFDYGTTNEVCLFFQYQLSTLVYLLFLLFFLLSAHHIYHTL